VAYSVRTVPFEVMKEISATAGHQRDLGETRTAQVRRKRTEELTAGSVPAVKRPSRKLDRRVLLLWWTVGGLLSIAGVVVSFALSTRREIPQAAAAAIATIIILVAAVLPPLRFRRWRYQIRERDILISKGALFFLLTLIPFDRIQFVETRQGPLDRLFRLNQIVLYTAAGKAGRIPGLEPAEAEALREELSKIAGAQTV
jgi:membrane protein YdbS with pleckstrin-like domain